MDLTGNARNLRSNQTDAERLLWRRFRNKQLLDCKFRRQFLIGHYIADIACLELKLLIEQADSDRLRTAELGSRGFTVIRFWNNDVLGNTEGVLEEIKCIILALKRCFDSPQPSIRRGKFLPLLMVKRESGRIFSTTHY